ncbi:hypothetical protein CIPAW_03G083800 [Carya illinoinensis]|uniref:Scarecrow-like protein 3 n=1 Tax=Carya illinoinensis TaxID=32201 RepID=A0A8T1QYD4_CARIL|nr:hypothetical protein CIPAW_03G083800 [Carya illinoinensis]
MSSTSPNSSKLDVNLFLTLPVSSAGPGPFEALKLEERGIHLIQLLLMCANHTSSGNLHHANACLCQILLLASVSCDPMQRLAARFAYALASRLSKLWPGLYKALSHIQRFKSTKGDRACAFFSQAFPYLGFAYAIIAWTLVQAMSEERVIHIVDLGSGDPKLWVPFMQSFALMDHGPYLKITCVNNNKVVLENLGTRLVKEAESLDMPVQFNHVNVSLKDLATDMLKIRSGEALAMVSILSLHVLLADDDYAHFGFGGSKGNGMKDCKQMAKFLAMVWSMSPKVFVKGLHYYSAIFDSLDVNYGSVSHEERLAAKEMFGREIEHIVACVGMGREERHERYVRWMVRFGRARLKTVLLWNEAMIMNDKACMMICWHERPLFAVSAWTC